MKKIFLIIATIFISTIQLMAQDDEFKSEASIQYAIGLPAGDLHNFIGRTSWLGITLDYRTSLTNNTFAGLEAAGMYFIPRKTMPPLLMERLP